MAVIRFTKEGLDFLRKKIKKPIPVPIGSIGVPPETTELRGGKLYFKPYSEPTKQTTTKQTAKKKPTPTRTILTSSPSKGKLTSSRRRRNSNISTKDLLGS